MFFNKSKIIFNAKQDNAEFQLYSVNKRFDSYPPFFGSLLRGPLFCLFLIQLRSCHKM